MNSVTVTFTEEQAKYLLGLIDLAVKATGMQVAENSVFLSRLIQDAMKPGFPQGTAQPIVAHPVDGKGNTVEHPV